MNKPFYITRRAAWFVKTPDNKSQILLHADKDEAFKKWHRMQAIGNPQGADTEVWVLCSRWLRGAKDSVGESHFKRSAKYLADFCTAIGSLAAKDLKAFHVTDWMNGKGWKSPSRRTAILTLKRVFNWAIEEGLIGLNPIAKMKMPAATRREVMIATDQHQQIMTAKPCGRTPGTTRKHGRKERAFQAVAVALRHTGARPGTVASVTAADVSADGKRWVLQKHKTKKKTGRPLIVYLDPCMQALTRMLMALRPKGPLFLNSRKQAWTKDAIKCRMTRLRKKLDLPPGTVAYGYRHGFAHRALTNGIPIATVAKLMGHETSDMIDRNYGHLEQATDYLGDASARATPPAE